MMENLAKKRIDPEGVGARLPGVSVVCLVDDINGQKDYVG